MNRYHLSKTTAVIVILLAILTSRNSRAQQLTTVAVVDIRAVSAAFPTQSSGVLNLDALKSQYESQIQEQANRLELLEKEKLIAETNEEYEKVITLQKRIQSLKSYIETLSKNFQEELDRRSRQPRSREFLIALQQSIEFVALDNGYSIVFQSTASGLQWWAEIVDITDMVIKRLATVLAR